MMALLLAYGSGEVCDIAKFPAPRRQGQAFLLRKDKTSYGKNISLPTRAVSPTCLLSGDLNHRGAAAPRFP
jgi:hypothetical protein